jgi:predicted MFS family arabinose efflux permease
LRRLEEVSRPTVKGIVVGTQTEPAWGAKTAANDELQQSLSTQGRHAAWYALLVLFAINLLNFFDRQILGSLAEPVRKEFHLSDTSLGLLATVFTLMYAVVGLPLGRLSDSWYRARLIALGTAVWSVFTAASGLAQTYTQLFVSRLGVGIGEAACAPAGQSLIGDLFPPQRRAQAMGVFMLGLPGGICLAYYCAGTIGAAWGWRATLLLACIPGLLLSVLALRIREPARGSLEAAAGGAKAIAPGVSPFIEVLRLPTMWWIILSGIFHNFNIYAINSFQTPFLQRFHEMSLKEASNVSAIAVGAVGAIGLLFGGWLADRLVQRRRNGRLLLASISMAIAAPCIFLAISQPKGAIAAFMGLMAAGTATMYVYYATVYAAIQDVIAPRLRGSAVAIYFCAMYVLGASLGPLATGMLSDYFARKAMAAAGAATMNESFKAIGLHNAMYAIPVLAVLASVVLLLASQTIERDIRKQAT